MAGVDVDDTQLISVHFFLYVVALNYYYFLVGKGWTFPLKVYTLNVH